MYMTMGQYQADKRNAKEDKAYYRKKLQDAFSEVKMHHAPDVTPGDLANYFYKYAEACGLYQEAKEAIEKYRDEIADFCTTFWMENPGEGLSIEVLKRKFGVNSQTIHHAMSDREYKRYVTKGKTFKYGRNDKYITRTYQEIDEDGNFVGEPFTKSGFETMFYERN